MTLRATGKVNSIPLLVIAEAVILVTIFGVPFVIQPLIAYSLSFLMMPVFGIGLLLVLPFLRIGKPTPGAAFSIVLIFAAIFVGYTSIFMTYHPDLRQVLLIAIPLAISILILYYLQKYTKEWNRK